VVTDRFLWSSRAYQGYGSGVPLDLLDGLERLSVGDTRPALVILVDVPARVGLARRNQGATEQMTRFEDEARHDEAFHERVRRGYQEMAAADPGRWRIIDGDRPIEPIASDIHAIATAFLSGSEPNGDLLRMSGQTVRR